MVSSSSLFLVSLLFHHQIQTKAKWNFTQTFCIGSSIPEYDVKSVLHDVSSHAVVGDSIMEAVATKRISFQEVLDQSLFCLVTIPSNLVIQALILSLHPSSFSQFDQHRHLELQTLLLRAQLLLVEVCIYFPAVSDQLYFSYNSC